MMTLFSVLAILLIFGRPGFIVSPKPSDVPATEATREQELRHELDLIYQEFPAEFWRRYHDQEARRDAETLVPDGPEHQELIRMTDEVEERNARRIGLLLDLAKVRKSPIEQVMREYRPQAAAHG